jgi:hypothetical protein
MTCTPLVVPLPEALTAIEWAGRLEQKRHDGSKAVVAGRKPAPR